MANQVVDIHLSAYVKIDGFIRTGSVSASPIWANSCWTSWNKDRIRQKRKDRPSTGIQFHDGEELTLIRECVFWYACCVLGLSDSVSVSHSILKFSACRASCMQSAQASSPDSLMSARHLMRLTCCLPRSTAFPGANVVHEFAKWFFWKLPFNLPYPFPLTCPGRLSALSGALIRVAVAMTAPTALFGLPHCRETDVYSASEGREEKKKRQHS